MLKPTYHQQLMRYAQAAYPGQFNANTSLPVVHGGLEFQPGAANAAAISMMPKVTSEMSIPSALMGGVIGRGGVNITHVRSLSGCAVKVRHASKQMDSMYMFSIKITFVKLVKQNSLTVQVHGQEDGKTDRRITFEGTAEQVKSRALTNFCTFVL